MANQPTFNVLDFKRDFELGNTGEDVAALHKIMSLLGYAPSSDEMKQKRFGTSTVEQAEKLRQAIAENPLLGFASFILQFIFGSDVEEAKPEFRRGTSKPIRSYQSAEEYQLEGLAATIGNKRGAQAAADLAQRYVGQRETGDNSGPVVRFFNGASGDGLPWCGGFVHKIMGMAISPKLFDQSDFLRARSFEDEAARHGAFRKKAEHYAPKVGDVVVFTRGGGQGHAGIVTDVSPLGEVTYISANDANAVRERSFDVSKPPQSLIGYADTQALAKAKGISIEVSTVAFSNVSSTKAARHSDAAILRG